MLAGYADKAKTRFDWYDKVETCARRGPKILQYFHTFTHHTDPGFEAGVNHHCNIEYL
jgi:hypothetical protein